MINIHFDASKRDDGTPKTIFHVNGSAPQTHLAEDLIIGPHQAAVDQYNAPQPGAGDYIGDIGDALWKCIKEHGNADAAFQPILAPGQSDRVIRVTFHPFTRGAKDLPWECLRHANGFFSFDMRVPVVREFTTAAENVPLSIGTGEKLRFLAVLAAKGASVAGEWRMLEKAIAPIAAQLPVEVLVLSSKKDVRTKAQQMANVTVKTGTVSDDSDKLVREVRAFAPHIAHFFCHGDASGTLQLEPSSAERGDTGSTYLSTANLEDALKGTATLAVLNACSLADPDGTYTGPAISGSANLCEELVSRGVPVVIGMRNPVDEGDARKFAETFHANVLSQVATQYHANGGKLELAECFADACRAILGGSHPTDALRNPAWTLPVMNRRPEDVTLERPLTAPSTADGDAPLTARLTVEEDHGELEILRLVLEDHADFYAGSLDQIKARIAELEAAQPTPDTQL